MSFDFEASFVEVRFPDGADNFLKVRETLTRIGAPAYPPKHQQPVGAPDKVLWQSCHILHKRQRFFLVHFKEMFLLDGKVARTNLTRDDLARRNAIALLLEEWGLVDIMTPDRVQSPPPAPLDTIKVIPFREKSEWRLATKYDIGKSAKYGHGERSPRD